MGSASATNTLRALSRLDCASAKYRRASRLRLLSGFHSGEPRSRTHAFRARREPGSRAAHFLLADGGHTACDLSQKGVRAAVG